MSMPACLRLPAELEEGNVEYKLQLKDPARARVEQLVSRAGPQPTLRTIVRCRWGASPREAGGSSPMRSALWSAPPLHRSRR
jgi:hypothetical protein